MTTGIATASPSTSTDVPRPAPAAPRPRRRRRRWPRTVLPPLVTFALLAVLWEWVATVQASVLPRLPDVATALAEEPDLFLSNLGYTLGSAALGFVIGVSVALVLAVLVVHVPLLHAAIMPVAVLIHATPVLAIAPALIVAFGFGKLPHVLIVALITFFPMLINAIAGLRSVSTELLDVFRSMAAGRMEVFWQLRLPSSLPFLFAAGKTCATLAIIGAIVSEFTGSVEGIGAVIITSTKYLDLPQMWAAIFLSAFVSLLCLGAVGLAERLVVRWR
ncbi:ABC transporter permease [Blastococcus sp. TF02A-26]|uniref:ABC transporter permease n=1 Tax=Blastococcus sp. TF02A-26 TaxID=2250577 RepID=UPI000DEA8D16|nr:ABC transporter permease [Blastococcus sp. TF02A-26]RBY86815.1 nitrate ABC transporter permease [Blastococcus sp. TF02A-26]